MNDFWEQFANFFQSQPQYQYPGSAPGFSQSAGATPATPQLAPLSQFTDPFAQLTAGAQAGQANISGFQNPVQTQTGQPFNNPQIGVQPSGFSQAVGIGVPLAQAWLGFNQLGVSRDALDAQKDAFNKNYQLSLSAYNRNVENAEIRAAGLSDGV